MKANRNQQRSTETDGILKESGAIKRNQGASNEAKSNKALGTDRKQHTLAERVGRQSKYTEVSRDEQQSPEFNRNHQKALNAEYITRRHQASEENRKNKRH